MKALYIILLLGAFLMGRYDGGDITYFVFLLILAPVFLESGRKKVRK